MFLEGNCTKGYNCRFAHSLKELRSTDSFYKKVLCNRWIMGQCTQADKCSYAHGESDMKYDTLEETKEKEKIF